MKTVGILLAGGRGSRFGAAKETARVADITCLDRSLSTLKLFADEVIVVATSGSASLLGLTNQSPRIRVREPESSRTASMRAATLLIPLEADRVLIHDAAHPLATSNLFDRVLTALDRSVDVVVPVIQAVDTIKRVRGDLAVETIDRAGLVVSQVPHAFWSDALRRIHREEREAQDDSVLAETLGMTVRVVPGEAWNIHIARPVDLLMARAIATAELIDPSAVTETS
jgi:2-C-methyl-D-erythritol 4-phosphate cytidylyltransferase